MNSVWNDIVHNYLQITKEANTLCWSIHSEDFGHVSITDSKRAGSIIAKATLFEDSGFFVDAKDVIVTRI